MDVRDARQGVSKYVYLFIDWCGFFFTMNFTRVHRNFDFGVLPRHGTFRLYLGTTVL